MKAVLATVLSVLFLSLASQAEARDVVYLDNVDSVDLAVELASLSVSVGYPGPGISGVCQLDIVADSYGRENVIANLLKVVTIEKMVESETVRVVSKTVIRVSLLQGGYLDGVTIKTKNGKSLAEEIRRTLGEGRKVKVVPRNC